MSFPKSCKAAVFTEANKPLTVKDVDLSPPKKGEILIKVEACGVCHSDSFAGQGMMGGLPRIPGHEIIGRIVAVGPEEDRWKEGNRVGGAWHGGQDNTCRSCRSGYFQMCDNAQVNGITRDGGYAEYCILNSVSAVRIDSEAPASQLAPLMCAGVTVYNGIRQLRITPGEVVAIQGLGGLGHLAVQYSRAMGYRTVALSRGSDKKDFAMNLGATDYIDTEKEDPVEVLNKMGGAALVVATAPNPKVISPLVAGCKAMGKLLLLTPVGDVPFNSIAMITKGISVHGWPSGHAQDTEDTVAFSERFGIKCMVEEFPLDKAQEAYQHMMDNKARFRAVLTMQ
ncbi:uncharacterized protein PFL1_01485 [Pseudozyma flocculosa PF-1]|uniref:Related to ADH2 - alcohol dehydrogenase II n=1 Tax=Pseudozyma flocculosa TaxID=84751 RepID=A0A5C3FBJ8_9BASI|nr:uncharacterized protein PFL1_01485 [Pseudozyma flocculosa PF-1]EPQ31300.1 hypothetical protein PFL1_01485 [Pseudozyma flocculosa PF-1]SPO41762.1 related to ADH2 - alcohol dehydrogenase II [Pseudozyma flocculosa]